LRDRYGKALIKQDLKTSDPRKVAQKVALLNAQVEAEWAGLEAAPGSSPESLKGAARVYLRGWGLEPQAASSGGIASASRPDDGPTAIDLLHDHIELKRQMFAGGDEERYREADSSDYLSPVEIEAGQQLHGVTRPTITDLQDVYLDTHKKRGREAFALFTRRTFAALVAVTGNKEIDAFTREDARRYLNDTLANGRKTATVRRRLNVFVAAWGVYRREKSPHLPNPFEKLSIPGEHEDKSDRSPFTPAQLAGLYAACRDKDDDRRWLFALMIDTGARIAEVTGLALDDLKVDAPVPHVVIRPHPWRTLKNLNSAREVPLVGASLWAARRILETAPEGQRFAFPRYTTETRCNNTVSSATLVKWVRGLKVDGESLAGNGLNHELRHSMSDRLREVQCPKPIMGAIEGHGKQDVADGYGHGYSLKVKLEWLQKVALKAPR
jgi:integrase